MKLAFVVQRYGLDISGGAELHCRWVAEHMARYADVEVLTTRAEDYITWKNRYPAGPQTINGLTVRRFSVVRPRRPERFGRLQEKVLHHEHREKDELRWLDEEGPRSRSLLRYIRRNEAAYDYFIFFSYRYYHSYWGVRTVPRKALLVPTAERDPVIGLRLFKPLFRMPRAFIYNSCEERDMIRTVSRNDDVPGAVVGVGTETPASASAERFRARHGVEGDYLIYIGRVDQNKGCPELFDFFLRYKQDTGSPVKLVMIGGSVLPIPGHPDIRYLGILPEEDKFDALAGARLLVMPSFYESLSMVTLEAWAMGQPVLANARCDVLKGQCLRSNGGLYYGDYREFREALSLLLASAGLREALGRNGLAYYQANYTWQAIENKYLGLLGELEGK
ncbi:MAG: hexosyltransferase [Candidatus Aminicenantes bacterium RBG_13_63_10]|nr:MAG: hexosyltransferase [Candidatus Aminicenantes bacterium RBG_13_63_10]